MKKSKIAALGISILIGAMTLSGCADSSDSDAATKEASTKSESIHKNSKVNKKNKDNKDKENKDKDSTESAQEVTGKESSTDSYNPEEAELWNKLNGQTFTFCSGAGAWATELEFDQNGVFSGYYYDSDAGDTTDRYPNGVRYECQFRGKFSYEGKVDDYTYCIRLETIDQKEKSGKEEIIDGVRVVYTDPYGLDEPDNFYIYYPGKKISELPEAYVSWTYGITDKQVLPFYGLYNENAQEGFAGGMADETSQSGTSAATGTGNTTGSGIDEELKNIDKESAGIDETIENAPSLTQAELNELAARQYKMWDDELNSIWSRLKTTLDESTMSRLTDEERQWITDKEEKVKAAGAEFEGGTAQGMVENMEAAQITRERVYELAGYLK